MWRALFIVVLIILCEAQEFRGTISGRVIDVQEAVVPNVRINVYGKLIERMERINVSDPVLSKRIGEYDVPYRFVISGSWDAPIGKGKTWLAQSGALLDRVIGGWNMDFIYTRQQGFPLSWGNVITYYGGDLHVKPRALDGAFDVTRFNRNSKEQLESNIRTSPSRFTTVRADGSNIVDLSVLKRIPIDEKIYFQFRCEFFNLLNHPLFEAPNTSPTNSNFGFTNTQSNEPRTIQMALRLVW